MTDQDIDHIKIFVRLTDLLTKGKPDEWMELFKSLPDAIQVAYAKMPIKYYSPDLAKNFESRINVDAIANNGEGTDEGGDALAVDFNE